MSRIIVTFLFGCILFPLVILAHPPGGETEHSEFVLILNAYSYEKEWSTTLAKEIRNSIETQRPGTLVNITYADITARTSFLADRFAMQGAFAYGRLTNEIYIPNVLVLIGDESWMLYRIMDHRGIWGEVPVVLCGMHAEVLRDYQTFFLDRQLPDTAFISLHTSAAALTTATVVESDYTPQTLQLARTLVPQLQNLYYLSDGSYLDAYMGKKLRRGSSNLLNLSFCNLEMRRNNVDSIAQVLKNLPANSVLVTNGTLPPVDVSVPMLTLRDMTFQSQAPMGGYFAPKRVLVDKTVELISQFLDRDSLTPVSETVVPDAAFYLNQTALLHGGLRSEVKDLPNAIDRNTPPPLIFRHFRKAALFFLILIVLAYIICRVVHTRFYRRNLNRLFERYKMLYDEYRVVYENMPVGLMLFDIDGEMLKCNAEAHVFLNRFACLNGSEFTLFSSETIDNDLRNSLLKDEQVAKVFCFRDFCYRMQCCMLVDEESEADQVLVIVVDNTAIEKERKDKRKIYNVLNFAMNKAMIGVAEYNLVDGIGFATDAWYDTLDVERGSINFSKAPHCFVPADREKLTRYLERVSNGSTHLFLENLQMRTRTGETHFIRCLIHPLKYAPEQKQVIVTGLVLNVDDEIAKEHELKAAVKKAQEADRFKNAFVANMRDEIRIPLKEILSCAHTLVDTEDLDQKNKLNARIEVANDKLLKLLNDIIEISKVGLNE